MDREITAKMMLTYLVVYFIIELAFWLLVLRLCWWRKSSDSWSLKRFHISPGLLGMHEVRMMAKRLLRLAGDWVIVASSIARLRCWQGRTKDVEAPKLNEFPYFGALTAIEAPTSEAPNLRRPPSYSLVSL